MTTQKPQEAVAGNEPKTRDRIIDVDGMKDDASVSRVRTALKTVKDLSVDAVKIGTVKLRSATADETRGACAAIKTAGFESREAPRLKATTTEPAKTM